MPDPSDGAAKITLLAARRMRNVGLNGKNLSPIFLISNYNTKGVVCAAGLTSDTVSVVGRTNNVSGFNRHNVECVCDRKVLFVPAPPSAKTRIRFVDSLAKRANDKTPYFSLLHTRNVLGTSSQSG